MSVEDARPAAAVEVVPAVDAAGAATAATAAALDPRGLAVAAAATGAGSRAIATGGGGSVAAASPSSALAMLQAKRKELARAKSDMAKLKDDLRKLNADWGQDVGKLLRKLTASHKAAKRAAANDEAGGTNDTAVEGAVSDTADAAQTPALPAAEGDPSPRSGSP